MNEHKWVVAASRLLAAYFALMALSGLVTSISTVYEFFSEPLSRGNTRYLVYVAGGTLPTAAWGWAAWFFFFRATTVRRIVTRGLHPEGYCQRCAYNLDGAAKCPECGYPAPTASS